MGGKSGVDLPINNKWSKSHKQSIILKYSKLKIHDQIIFIHFYSFKKSYFWKGEKSIRYMNRAPAKCYDKSINNFRIVSYKM